MTNQIPDVKKCTGIRAASCATWVNMPMAIAFGRLTYPGDAGVLTTSDRTWIKAKQPCADGWYLSLRCSAICR